VTRLLACVALVALLAPASGLAAWGWLTSTVMSDFDEADWSRLEATTREAFDDAKDGERRDWSNPGSGNRGAVKPLLSFTQGGRPCRRMAFLSIGTRTGRGVATHTLCRDPDGALSYLPPSEHPR
jgi:surface antigen